MAGDKVASLIVRIGANDQAIQSALASVGTKAKSLDADLKKLGASPLAGGATKSLESLKSTMKQITDAQERVAERGRLAAQGLEAMGGASRLTESQLKQVNKTLQAGLESYRALGKEAPAELRRVADSVKSSVAGMSEPMSMIEKKAIALGTAVGTFLGNAAIQVGREFIQAGQRAFDYADALSNLSATTKITVEGLQRIEALGVTSGVSLEELAASVGMLQKNLDNPAAINALGKMGHNYKEIRALKPEDQFIEIASSVAAIEDPVERANAGAALFGRQWATIAPAIQGNIKEIIASVQTLSKEQIDALDEAGDAWDQFVKDSERGVTRFLGNLVLDAKKGELALTDLLAPMRAIQKLQAGHFAREADPGFDAALKRLPGFNAETGRGPGLTIRGAGPVIPDAGAKALKEFDEAAERAKASAERFKTVQDQLFGRAIIANAELLVRALGDDENLTRLTAEATKKLHGELGQAIAVYQALGKQVPPQLQDIYEKTLRIANTPIQVKAVGAPSLAGLTKTFVAYGEAAADGTLYAENYTNALILGQIQTDKYGRTLAVDVIPSVKRVGVELAAAGDKAVSFADAFKSIFTGKGFGDLGAALKGSLGDVKTGIFEGFGHLISGGITSLISKGLGLLTQGLGKLWGKFFGTAGRDAVREFAGDQGGFDALHKRLSLLGDEGERLWVTLTQGVGRGNAEQAKKAIGEVTAALDEQKRKFDELEGSIGTAGEKLSGLTDITPEVEAAIDAVFAAPPAGLSQAVDDLNAALDKQAGKFNDIKGLLQKYNIAASEVKDPAFKQQATNQRAVELRKDYDLARAAALDMNVYMRAAGKSVNEFVNDARKMGVEVPESMREVIQVAIDAGEVFDADGKKITNINDLGLTFGTTMQTTMAKVETAVGRLSLVLEGLARFLGVKLPEAAERGVDGINDALDGIETPVIKPRIEFPESPNPGDHSGDHQSVDGASTGARVTPFGLQHLKGGGFARGTDTIPAMLTPGELVLNAAQQANLGAALAGGGRGGPTLVVEQLIVTGVFSEGDLKQTMVRHILPTLNELWEDNINSSRTNAQDVLGVPRAGAALPGTR